MPIYFIPKVFFDRSGIPEHLRVRANLFASLFCVMGFVLLLPQIALNLPVDSFCLWKAVIGIPCPGCGLTRALHFAFRFEWGKSLSFHPLGIPIAGAWFAIALMQATGIARNETIGRREMTVLRAVGRSFYILIVVVWIKVVLGGGI